MNTRNQPAYSGPFSKKHPLNGVTRAWQAGWFTWKNFARAAISKPRSRARAKGVISRLGQVPPACPSPRNLLTPLHNLGKAPSAALNPEHTTLFMRPVSVRRGLHLAHVLGRRKSGTFTCRSCLKPTPASPLQRGQGMLCPTAGRPAISPLTTRKDHHPDA